MISRTSEQKGEKTSIQTHPEVYLTGTFFDNPSDKGIILFPGFTEHRSSLYGLAEKLNKKGFKTWSFDINSQGESTGDWDLKQMAESVYEVQKQLRKKHGLKKMGAFGNSIGGMAVIITAAEDNSSLDSLCVSATGPALQDYVSKFVMGIARHIPQSVLRQATIAFDKLASLSNRNYRQKTHSQFKTSEGYAPYAQFGALKIRDVKDFVGWVDNAPRLDDYTGRVVQPTLFVYGGQDRFLKFSDSGVPEKIQALFYGVGSKNKDFLVVPCADHSLNLITHIDDCFNQDERFSYVKKKIAGHFMKYLS